MEADGRIINAVGQIEAKSVQAEAEKDNRKRSRDDAVIDLSSLADDAYITEEVLSDALAVSDRQIRRMVHYGQLPQPFILAHRKRWRVGDIKDHIDAMAEQAQKEREKMEAEKKKIRAKNAVL